MHRKRVEHFVDDDGTAPAFREPVDPFDPGPMIGQCGRDLFALSLAQLGAHLEQPVARGQGILLRECCEHVHAKTSRARAQLDDLGIPNLRDHLRKLARQRLPEQRGKLGRGHEIAFSAELARSGGVIAKARRVEDRVHVIGERDPAASFADFAPEIREHPFAVHAFVGRQWRRVAGRIGWSREHRCARLAGPGECSRSAACKAKSC